MLRASTTVLVASLAGLGLIQPAVAAAARLSPADIKTTFGTGMPFTAASSNGAETYTFVFHPDGTASQKRMGVSGKSVTGRWRTSDKGYCSTWGANGEHCYTVEKNGTRYDVRDAAGKVISHWSL